MKEKTITLLNSAKASINKKEPDKEVAKAYLGKPTKNELQDESKVFGSSMTLCTKVELIITKMGN
ncbi:MAG: hypothetical protein O4861_24855 [Trichodesmium sp. St16_bin4-tuft]|nr:hypothetical protein [Trichodesmium sp. MAG_R01]MDE5069071.1 hypothetical protein [Trichodesmium sp. St4_bin8_1]MDE5077928.1 hypothetical protein [Trichodesmium sp. St2_bin6]MDE5090292.1 hypothetical protein [Trichodesmium sp. St18_bin3_1_1]MDE5101381.1 hypothetical protein [Trichodesmium sp. St16_bin4-tuft]MDE5102156.1 hypothetical protein [Trichodesmium sp. St19_bin2]